MTLCEETLDNENAYMEFTLPNGTVQVAVKDAVKKTMSDGTVVYGFSCGVVAKEMTKDIVGKMVYGANSTGKEHTYSVKNYADYIIANSNDEKLVALVTNMLHYGAYAQTHFNYNTDNMANAGMEALDLSGVTAESFKEHPVLAGEVVSGVNYFGSSLILESGTTLRIRFTLDEGVTATCNGEPLTEEVTRSQTFYYADIADVAARDLDKSYTITISNGTESETMTISVFTYCYDTLAYEHSYGDALNNVVKTLYLYNEAANAYFGN